MIVQNADIAAIFSQIADFLEIKGDNPFRVRAYRNAARTLNTLPTNVQETVKAKQSLQKMPGIGADLEEKINEIVETGTCALREELRQELPPALYKLLTVPGLGPKRVKTLYQELNIQNLEQLYRAASKGTISGVPGFGKRVEQRILEALQAQRSKKMRIKFAVAEPIVNALLAHLRSSTAARQVEVAGSFRRRQETVGDVDILVSSSHPAQVVEHFLAFENVEQVLAQGKTRASVMLRGGLQVDLRVVANASFGAALYYFTGSKAHGIEVRKLAQEQGLKINEYGIYSGARRVAGETEVSVFGAVGLHYIEPELRENRGEIEAAQKGKLPDLVTVADLKGDLHAHTTETDGKNSMRDMAMEAKRRGLSYLGITDHSQRLYVAHGLNAERLSKQIDAIDRLNDELHGITLLKGIEVDINEDGTLDMDDRLLERLDYVIGAVHSKFALPRQRQTERILRAMDHPCFTLLAHPSGRLIFEREAYEVDMQRIIRHAKERGCFLELNAQPDRLDLTDTYCMLAKSEGVLVSIDSDAHSVFDLDHLRLGINQARRGWLEKSDVLNTQPLEKLRSTLAGVRVHHLQKLGEY